MNTAARAWVKALESDEFQQTTSYLRTAGGYCCLGVACELALKAGIIKQKKKIRNERRGSGITQSVFAYEGQTYYLPEEVRRWLGLTTLYGNFGESSKSLISLNDDGSSFKQIAAVIKKQPKGLFSTSQKKKLISTSQKKKSISAKTTKKGKKQ